MPSIVGVRPRGPLVLSTCPCGGALPSLREGAVYQDMHLLEEDERWVRVKKEKFGRRIRSGANERRALGFEWPPGRPRGAVPGLRGGGEEVLMWCFSSRLKLTGRHPSALLVNYLMRVARILASLQRNSTRKGLVARTHLIHWHGGGVHTFFLSKAMRILYNRRCKSAKNVRLLGTDGFHDLKNVKKRNVWPMPRIRDHRPPTETLASPSERRRGDEEGPTG